MQLATSLDTSSSNHLESKITLNQSQLTILVEDHPDGAGEVGMYGHINNSTLDGSSGAKYYRHTPSDGAKSLLHSSNGEQTS